MNQSLSHQVPAEAERKAARRLEEFRKLRNRGALCTEATEQLATEAATVFLSRFRDHGLYLADAITLLSEIATLEEPCLSEPGQRATFPLLVERLSDSFDPQDCLLYDRVFAQMISHCRQLPSATGLDHALRRFGLDNEHDLLERKARLRHPSPLLDLRKQRAVQKVLALSRVTLGADVAVTSVALQKAKIVFPQAERVLLGLPKAGELFGGDPTLRLRNVPYPTDGGLLDRLLSWLPVREAVEEEIAGLRPEEYVAIDPDSRLLQLGLLPALREESRYFFFESRRLGNTGTETISQLTLDWLNETFGGSDQILPKIWLRETDVELGRSVRQRLPREGSPYVVAVNFGAGGNPHKRLPNPFEEQLVLRLLEEGCAVWLDKGSGQEELARSHRLVEQVKAGGWAVVPVESVSSSDRLSKDRPLGRGLLTWQGGIGAWSGLLAASDEYIGYDSAGQHIAAALGVPTVDIFAEDAGPVFRARWRPTGRGLVRVVTEADRNSAAPIPRAILSEVMDLHREVKLARVGSGDNPPGNRPPSLQPGGECGP